MYGPSTGPGSALVFLTNSTSLPPQDPYVSLSQATKTFSTSTVPGYVNTSRVAPSVLATSNGHSGVDREQLGSTSSNLKNQALLGDARGSMKGLGVLVGLVVGGSVTVLF